MIFEQQDRQHNQEQNNHLAYVSVDDLTNDFVREEANEEVMGDISLKRIKRLLNIAKSALFSGPETTRARLQEMDEKFTNREVDVMIKILNFLQPYIASKDNYYLFQYQLPFVLMANQVLRFIGYEGQVLKFVPIIKPSSLHALQMDTTTLYALFCAQKSQERMYLKDFNGNNINATTALASKDPVFSSFFNIDLLKKKSASYGLSFANRIYILPGLKTVRIYGTYRGFTQRKVSEVKKKSEYQESDSTVKNMVTQKSDLQNKLKGQVKELDAFIVGSSSVRSLKRGWKGAIDGDKEEWYQKVEIAKLKKRQLMIDICNTRQEIQTIRKMIYEARHSPEISASVPPKTFTVNSTPCERKVEDCRLSKDVDLKEARFSGTDNGIIKTTETAYFDTDRFTYHLKLYNRFQSLGKFIKNYGFLLF